MDASAYMDQLKAEAQALRMELASFDQAKAEKEAAISNSISAYVSSLPESQLAVLTSGISEDVVGAMRQGGYNLGGEQSGHLIFLDHSTTGDGLVAGLGFLGALVQSGQTVSELAGVLKPYPQSLVNVPVKQKTPLEELPTVQEQIRAAEEQLGDDGRVLVRYSGTENKARVLVEGPDAGVVGQLAGQIGAALEAGS